MPIYDDYDKQFRATVDYIKVSTKRGFGEFHDTTDSKYVCTHDPCCGNCYFGSESQRDFEKFCVRAMGNMEVTSESLIEAAESEKKWKDVRGRLNHLGVSPRYAIMVGEYEDKSGRGGMLMKVLWGDLMSSCTRYVKLKRKYDGIVNSRKTISGKRAFNGQRRGKTEDPGVDCSRNCGPFRFLISASKESINRRSVHDDGELTAYTTGRPVSAASTMSMGPRGRSPAEGRGTLPLSPQRRNLDPPQRPPSAVRFLEGMVNRQERQRMDPSDPRSAYTRLMESVASPAQPRARSRAMSRASTNFGTDYNGAPPTLNGFEL